MVTHPPQPFPWDMSVLSVRDFGTGKDIEISYIETVGDYMRHSCTLPSVEDMARDSAGCLSIYVS